MFGDVRHGNRYEQLRFPKHNSMNRDRTPQVQAHKYRD